MAVVLPGKFVYLCTPYTDEDATTKALKQLPGAFVAVDKFRGVKPHATMADVQRVFGDRLDGTEHVFTVVRNPYDLLVEWYLREIPRFQLVRLADVLGRTPNLREFIDLWVSEPNGPEPYRRGGRMFYHALECKTVLRWERGVEREVNGLLRKLPQVDQIKMPPRPAEPQRDHWSTYYDRDTYALVNEQFRDDFVAHGYQFHWE
jgi:hypothetical protein